MNTNQISETSIRKLIKKNLMYREENIIFIESTIETNINHECVLTPK